MSKGSMKRYSKVVWPGFSTTPAPRQSKKVGRNDPCPCGSEKKYKDCHQAAGSAYLQKLARRDAKEHLREVRTHLKEQGVPWYRRLFVRL